LTPPPASSTGRILETTKPTQLLRVPTGVWDYQPLPNYAPDLSVCVCVCVCVLRTYLGSHVWNMTLLLYSWCIR
jgi:hypothetical protein